MGTFNYDKDKFNIEGIDELIEQAINYGSKNVDLKLKEQIQQENDRLKQLELELSEVKNQTKLSSILSDVDEDNKKIILELANNDINKIDSIKSSHPKLFEKQVKVNLLDAINGNDEKLPPANFDKKTLAIRFENGENLSDDELNELFQ